ncbi:MAG: helix-turn-helix domain-containing protein [Pyrinomonadaceae bacterium]
MNEFGMAFRRARLNSDMTFRDIANIVSKSIGYLSELESGKKNPPDRELVGKLELALGITDGHLKELAEEARFNLPSNINNLVRAEPRLGVLLKSCEIFFREDRSSEKDKELAKELEKIIRNINAIREREGAKRYDSTLFSNPETFLLSGMEVV